MAHTVGWVDVLTKCGKETVHYFLTDTVGMDGSVDGSDVKTRTDAILNSSIDQSMI